MPSASTKRRFAYVANRSDKFWEIEINGKEVHRMSRADAMNVDGVVGLRVNHNLDVHIEDFKVNGKGVTAKKAKA